MVEMATAHALAQAAKLSGKKGMAWDWDKAAAIIAANKAFAAWFYLDGDMDNTFTLLWRDGKPVEPEGTAFYPFSMWAVPTLLLGNGEAHECWRLEDDAPPEWYSERRWPASALAILNA